jgi:hypothetical protein
MKAEEKMAMNYIRQKIGTATDHFLKAAYKMLKKELMDRGLLRIRTKKED